MNMKEICPCPNVTCPNHGYCDKCISRHVRVGFLNYCSFQTLLPALRQVIDNDPESPSSKQLDALIDAQLQAYEKLMNEHDLSQEHQNRLLQMVAKYSDY